mmetsp:Transcript_118913/g.233571  ORF Transcript_118913/g.233571 Transcript_118913/m.233571 type:complete len:226 (+) Transcript_118913:376-1053(+)
MRAADEANDGAIRGRAQDINDSAQEVVATRRLAPREDHANLLRSRRLLGALMRLQLNQGRLDVGEKFPDILHVVFMAHGRGDLLHLHRGDALLLQKGGDTVRARAAPLLQFRPRAQALRRVDEFAHLLRGRVRAECLRLRAELQLEGHRDVRRDLAPIHVVLDRAGNVVSVQQAELVADFLVCRIRLRKITFQLDEGLANHGLVLALTSLNHAQGCDRNATALPL